MKRFSLALPILFLILMALGCERDAAAEPVQPEAEMKAGETAAASQKQTVLKFVVNHAERPFPPGLDLNRNPYVEYIEAHTGVDLHLIAPSPGNYQESLHLIMNSADVPDVINTGDPAWIAKYVELGLLTPLDELLETHGRRLLEIFPEEAWKAVTFNGHIYAVPSLTEVSGNEVMYVRKDWLDALGLEPPETLDEYYEVMYAFTYQDPDRNGVNDTIGITIMPDGLSRTAPFFGAFGVPRSINAIMQWKETGGSLTYGGILPETKETLAFLHKLYGDGLIDRQFILNKKGSFEEKIASGRVGLFSAAWYDTKGPILENKKRDPNAEWMRLPYPKGPNGLSGTAGLDIVQSYTVIPKQSEHAEDVLRVLEFIAGEGYRTLKLGFEGEVWMERDGVIVTDFAKHEEHIYRGTLHAIVDPNDPQVRKERLDSLGKEYQLNDNVEFILKHVLRSDFQGPPTPSMGRYGAQLRELENETFLRIIMGLEPVDEFDRFVNRWMSEGGWEITYEVNQWVREHAREEP